MQNSYPKEMKSCQTGKIPCGHMATLAILPLFFLKGNQQLQSGDVADA
ncbi:MAG: hypothetical protein WBI14_04395 [Anaerolineaceae bacterium]